MSSMVASGSSLGAALAAFGAGRDYELAPGLSISQLSGKPVDIAIQTLVDCLAPPDEDRDRVRAGMVEALSTALEGVQQFEPEAITEEVVFETLTAYLTECVFELCIEFAAKALERSVSPEAYEATEQGFRALIKEVVSIKLDASAAQLGSTMTQASLQVLQQQVLQQVWVYWESDDE